MKKTLDELFEYMDKRVRVIDTTGKEFIGLCWGVYSAVDNEDDDGIAEDSIEVYDGACAYVLYANEIITIDILDNRPT